LSTSIPSFLIKGKNKIDDLKIIILEENHLSNNDEISLITIRQTQII